MDGKEVKALGRDNLLEGRLGRKEGEKWREMEKRKVGG